MIPYVILLVYKQKKLTKNVYILLIKPVLMKDFFLNKD